MFILSALLAGKSNNNGNFSNFGSAPYPESIKVKQATELVKKRRPDLMVDGEMQVDTAVVPEIIEDDFPFSSLKGRPNVLVFPDLNSGNIAYKLMARYWISFCCRTYSDGYEKTYSRFAARCYC